MATSLYLASSLGCIKPMNPLCTPQAMGSQEVFFCLIYEALFSSGNATLSSLCHTEHAEFGASSGGLLRKHTTRFFP